jgi:hypothetical protein
MIRVKEKTEYGSENLAQIDCVIDSITEKVGPKIKMTR